MLQEDEKDERKMCRVVGQVKREGNRGDGGGMGGCRLSSSLPEYMDSLGDARLSARLTHFLAQ